MTSNKEEEAAAAARVQRRSSALTVQTTVSGIAAAVNPSARTPASAAFRARIEKFEANAAASPQVASRSRRVSLPAVTTSSVSTTVAPATAAHSNLRSVSSGTSKPPVRTVSSGLMVASSSASTPTIVRGSRVIKGPISPAVPLAPTPAAVYVPFSRAAPGREPGVRREGLPQHHHTRPHRRTTHEHQRKEDKHHQNRTEQQHREYHGLPRHSQPHSNERDPFADPPPPRNEPVQAPPRSTPSPVPAPSPVPSSDTRRPVTRLPLEPRTDDAQPEEPVGLPPSSGEQPIFDFPSTPHLELGDPLAYAPVQTDPTGGTAHLASSVFAKAAPKLHLPALDAYLGDAVRFPPTGPVFSDPRLLCSEEEMSLFGYDRARKTRNVLEVAGGQFVVPARCGRGKGKAVKQEQEQREEHESELDEGDVKDREISDKDDDDDETAVAVPLNKSQDLTSSAAATSAAYSSSPSGVSSSMSSNSKPRARLEMFPPLMLLRETSLDELKSNAVGPRKPPGGLLGKIPTLSSILGTIVDFVVGVEGSAFAAGIFRLELLRDFAQIMTVMLHYEAPPPTKEGNGWLGDGGMRRLLLHTIPSILSLDFVPILGKALIFLAAAVGLVAVLLVKFWHMTRAPNPNSAVEGFGSQPWLFGNRSLGSKFVNILTVFLLSTLYIPVSKLAVDALTWNADFWPVENPYRNLKPGDELNLPSLGPSNVYREPTDFCWTTTMRQDEFNFAWIIIPAAALTVCAYTLWFPYVMAQTIRHLLPRPSDYNELGQKRTPQEKDQEYMRLLDRDRSPLNFMYNAYKRKFGYYKPWYIMCFKLTNLIVISFFSSSNCLWRSHSMKTMLVTQQSILIGLMSTLLIVHLCLTPFVDQVHNRSELVSRFGYVLTALIGLLVALQVQGSTVYNTTILYLIQALTYLCNIYFALTGTNWMGHQIKRMQNRLDFSIDVFSPALDVHKHVKRRVWEETLSTILLCGPSYQMSQDKLVVFSTTADWPPYLLWFEGSAAERHVENIKILKTIGIDAYRANVQALRGDSPRALRLRIAIKTIQTRFAGPDAYWRPTQPPFPEGVSSWFGKAFMIPFPPTLVIRYDQQSDALRSVSVQLTSLEDLEDFIRQNEDSEIHSRKWVRAALRALDGQMVFCPHVQTIQIGGRVAGQQKRRKGPFGDLPDALSEWRQGRTSSTYTLATPLSYMEGVLRVRRREGTDTDVDVSLAAGFEVSITYADGRRQDPEGLTRVQTELTLDGAAAFGLHDDFSLTPGVARFLRDNERAVSARIPHVNATLHAYRTQYAAEARRKRHVLDYAFLTDIFDSPQMGQAALVRAFQHTTGTRSVRELPERYSSSVAMLHERMIAINKSDVHRWWWLFWDDVWRQNSRDYKVLRTHRRVFCPHFPTSIGHRPMPRAQLENMLAKRGLWQKDGAKGVINRGLLNRLYFHLDMLVFAASDEESASNDAVRLALGRIDTRYSGHELLMESHAYGTIDTHLGTNSRYTGGGTVHDGSDIIQRTAWPWAEQRLGGRPAQSRNERAWNHFMEWLALQPYKANTKMQALYLYLDLVDTAEGQHYELPAPRHRAYAKQRNSNDPNTTMNDDNDTDDIPLLALKSPN